MIQTISHPFALALNIWNAAKHHAKVCAATHDEHCGVSLFMLHQAAALILSTATPDEQDTAKSWEWPS